MTTIIQGKEAIRNFLLYNRYLVSKGKADEIDYVAVNDREEVIFIFYKKTY